MSNYELNRELELVKEKKLYAKWITIGLVSIFMFIVFLMVGLPIYNVWSSRKSGQAEMAKAEQNRKIQVEEAKANLESQKLNSQAEVERAKGMAKAIEIENGKLTKEYIQYLWVRNIDKMDGEKIYIATEANLPVLEAKK